MWWQNGVLYQIYPRSFQDSDGDGVGDLRGVIDRLDHLQWLGVDGIWLNPTFPSPNADWGYDVADYKDVHPALGTLEDLDALIAAAGERDIKVLLDLVPNHTSNAHRWFRENPDYYVWSDDPPNNWQSNFGGSAWTRDEQSGRYYLHNFLAEQPDLDWWNDAVRDEFDDILRFWFDRGVAGFRIDVCHAIIKDAELRDDPAATTADHPEYVKKGWVPVFSMNRPEVHDVLRRWRGVADEKDSVLVGETYVLGIEELMPFYGSGTDELHLAFNFLFVHEALDAAKLRAIVEQLESLLPQAAWPVWTGSNHDAGRLATRWCGDDPRLARATLIMLLTLRGTPFLYYGDEIGLPDVHVPPERELDPAPGRRDDCRTPMPWTAEPGAGFTEPGVEPWLPIGEPGVDVAGQRADPASTLNLVRDLIALRRAEPDLHGGAYRTLPAPEGAWAWTRGDGFAIAVNFGAAPVEIAGVEGEIALAADRGRDGEPVDGTLRLEGSEAAVVRLR
jgi:alpha-glucosidase